MLPSQKSRQEVGALQSSNAQQAAISHSEHDPFMDDKSNYDLALASKDVHSHMCHGQNMFWFPIEGDGHATIDTDFDTHYMDSYCGMDDHTPYTMF